MDNSQIENTINEIRKRNGTVTVFTIMIFVIGGLMLTDNIVFAQDDDEKTQTDTVYLCHIVDCELSIVDVLIHLGFVISIPIIYHSVQKVRRRRSIRTIWSKKVDELSDLKNSANISLITLESISFELKKLETLIADSFSDETYVAYTLKIRYTDELINNAGDTKLIAAHIENFLVELIRLN